MRPILNARAQGDLPVRQAFVYDGVVGIPLILAVLSKMFGVNGPFTLGAPMLGNRVLPGADALFPKARKRAGGLTEPMRLAAASSSLASDLIRTPFVPLLEAT
uniref:Uncharacterized protein n=1 Tax=uncultured marine bacterium Ant4D5 TaxID=360428 RepID=Q2PXZ2_9BACT|nr:hypothetical protein [uncultured marine bacterium Ant4D5]